MSLTIDDRAIASTLLLESGDRLYNMADLEEGRTQEILAAIKQIRQKISWKPDKAQIHLAKRIRLGHLSSQATLEDYQSLIRAILNNKEAKLYIFIYESIIYPTVVANFEQRLWLVMFGLTGILETAFPPNNPELYLANPAFLYLGFLKDWEQ
jgi:hypothetical protein